MKYCEECGAQLEDNAKFCDECGAVIVSEPENILNDTNHKINNNSVVKKNTDKNTKKVIGIFVSVILIIGITVVGIYFVTKGNKKDNVENKKNSEVLENTSSSELKESNSEDSTKEENTTEGKTSEDESIATEETTIVEEITTEVETTTEKETSEKTNNKKYIEEYLKIINEKGYFYTYDLIFLSAVSNPLLVVYSDERAECGYLGDVYLYTEISGLQSFGCSTIWSSGGNKIMTKYKAAIFTQNYYYEISDNGVKELGETVEGLESYTVNKVEVDWETYDSKNIEWFGHRVENVYENGRYSNSEMIDYLSLLKNS